MSRAKQGSGRKVLVTHGYIDCARDDVKSFGGRSSDGSDRLRRAGLRSWEQNNRRWTLRRMKQSWRRRGALGEQILRRL